MPYNNKEEWSCSMCTLLNNSNEKNCSACGSVNISIEWSCSYCTLLNNTQYERCIACGNLRSEPDEIPIGGNKEFQQSTIINELKDDPLNPKYEGEPNFLLLPLSVNHQHSTHGNSKLLVDSTTKTDPVVSPGEKGRKKGSCQNNCLAEVGVELNESDNAPINDKLRYKVESPQNNLHVKYWECIICTNRNSPISDSCELCMTKKDHVGEQFPPMDNDAEYEILMLCSNKSSAGGSFITSEAMDEIKNSQCVQIFHHFVPVEELQIDSECKIKYGAMFSSTRIGKSYSDRLSKRTRESQRRLRQHDLNHSEKKNVKKAHNRSDSASGKGSAQSKKNNRHFHHGILKDSACRARTHALNSVNHYNSGDVCDDLSTMIWEGLGGASYSEGL